MGLDSEKSFRTAKLRENPVEYVEFMKLVR
jgi:hypothetical protein